MHSVFAFGCREDTFALPDNPVAGTEKRRETDPAEIVTYTPFEVLVIAEEARLGAHRNLTRLEVGAEEQRVRQREDEQDACLILVAAFSGLRMGELLALRWRHVIWEAQRLHVQRAYTLGRGGQPERPPRPHRPARGAAGPGAGQAFPAPDVHPQLRSRVLLADGRAPRRLGAPTPLQGCA